MGMNALKNSSNILLGAYLSKYKIHEITPVNFTIRVHVTGCNKDLPDEELILPRDCGPSSVSKAVMRELEE